MEYLIISVRGRPEKAFYEHMFERMNKKTFTIPAKKLSDVLFKKALKDGEKSGKGSLDKVKEHLAYFVNT